MFHGAERKDGKPSGTERVLQILLSLILISILLPLPSPAMPVNHPYRVELLLSLFLIAFLIMAARRWTPGDVFPSNRTRLVRPIFFALVAFVIWSGFSAVWAKSVGSVAHHTLLWSMFLVFLLVFTGLLRPGIRFLTGTFVVASLIIAFLCILDYLTVSDFSLAEATHRARYAKSAELLATLSPVLWAAAIYARRRNPVLMLAAAMSWVTVMLSLSKGAFIAGIAGFAIFFLGSVFFGMRRFRKRVIVAAAIWLVLTAGTQIFFSIFSAFPSTSDYISGTADPARTSSNVRVFVWSVARQMATDNWLIGVGADNFAMNLDEARAQYRAKHFDDPAAEVSEDYLLERPHNEPLQVFAELGVIGFALLLLPFVIFAAYFLSGFRRGFSRFSVVLWSALGGTATFMVSSMFSSFSFRSAQNGVVLFAVFAIAINELAKLSRQKTKTADKTVFRPALYASACLCTVTLVIFCIFKLVAEYHLYQAERSLPYETAKQHFQAALTADPEYAGASLQFAYRMAAEGEPAEAARMIQKSIDYGAGAAVSFSKLALVLTEAGDAEGADAAFRKGLSIYPRSIFLRTEFVVFLEKQGRLLEAAGQADVAKSMNPKQAKGWYVLVQQGSSSAFNQSLTDPKMDAPADLNPQAAVRRYLDAIPVSVQ